MSDAELLRRAAAELRSDRGGHPVPEFAVAVADWLDSEAAQFDAYMARQMDPQRRFNSVWLTRAQDRHEHAIAVARAYLGEQRFADLIDWFIR